jgi:hypothetical protein
MKVQYYTTGDSEEKVLIGMICSTAFLARIAAIWQEGLFPSKYHNIIAGWCIHHYKKYHKAPRRGIESYYAEWQERTRNEDLARNVGNMLVLAQTAAQQIKELNFDHLIDLAQQIFWRTQYRQLGEGVLSHTEAGKFDRVASLLSGFRKVEMGIGSGNHILMSEEAAMATFIQERREQLIRWPEGLGRFFTNEMEREGFISFCGPQKTGKTFWLLKTAFLAASQRRKVAFFEIGDLSQRQINLRFYTLVAAHPYRPTLESNGEWPCTMKIPTTVKFDKGTPHADVEYRYQEFKKPLDADTAWSACQKFMNEVVRSRDSYMKVACYPNLSISISGIKDVLDAWEREEGFIPDVVVIDYADNLAPVDRREDPRQWINTTWKMMSSLRQDRHCLLVTATQVKAAGFDVPVLDRRHFAEDNRKLNHVTGMVGINMTADEKELGLCRLNWIVKREGDFGVWQVCHVAGCLGIADIAIQSVFPLG